jgi:hypothetical protein
LRYEIALDRQISRSLLRLQQLQARELPVGELEERNSKRAVRTTRPIEEKIARHADSRTQETTATERTRQPHETIVQTPTDPRATRQPAQSTRQLRPLVPTVMVAVPTQSGSLQPPVTVKATQVTGRRSQKRS